jgi:hypothetical protein
MRVVGTVDSTDHLCNYCQLTFDSCPKAAHIKFGDGKGNDNVIECSEFLQNGYTSQIIGKPELGVFPSGERHK